MPEGEPRREQLDWLEFLRSAIIEGRQRVEMEFERSPQNWLNCFASVVSQIKTSLEFVIEERSLPADQLNAIQSHYSEMAKAFAAYRPKYLGDNQPPDEVRDELLGYIDQLEAAFNATESAE